MTALGSTGPAAALEQMGALGASPANTDYYQVTCSDDGSGPPVSLVTWVLDLAPVAAPLVSVQSQKGFLATNGTDPEDGDEASSPEVFLNGGAGTYDVFVDKTEAGAETYRLGVRCMTGMDGAGVETGTDLEAIATGPGQVPALPPLALLPLAGILVAAAARALRRGRRGAGSAALLAALALPGPAWAHTQSGALGTSAAATDFYQITCSDDGSGPPASLAIQVLDAAPAAAPLVSVQAQRGALATNGTDPGDGDAVPSPAVFVNGGPGSYDVLVYKTASGSESYTLTYHCLTGPDGTGIHTGTSIVTRQNQ